MVELIKSITSGIKANGLRSFLFKTQNSIISAAFILVLASSFNALLGFVKGRVTATYFGDSPELATFITADKIPSFIYSIIVTGSLTTIFVPVFAGIYKKNKTEAYKTASAMINITLLCFLVLSVIGYIFSFSIIKGLGLGTFTPEQITLGSNLLRIMLSSQLILVLSSFLTALLQSFKHFLATAIAPILYNVGFIIGTIIFVKDHGVYAMAYGAVLGSLLHLLTQLPFIVKTDFKYVLTADFRTKEIKSLFYLLIPRILSVSLTNALYTINNSFALLISQRSAAHLRYAGQVQNVPVLVFGISLATAVLPTLSMEGDAEERGKFKDTFLTSFYQMLYLVVPVSVILLVLRIPVIRIIYGAENFPWEATVKTAYSLAFFSISIFAQSAVLMITRAFYALKDTQTPVKVSMFTILINVLLSLFFINQLNWGVWSIAFAFSITSLMDMVVMFFYLHKKVGFDLKKVLIPFTKIGFSGLLMGAALYIPLKFLDQVVFDTTRVVGLLILTGIASVLGMITYLVFTKLLKVEEIELFYRIVRKLQVRRSYKDLGDTLSTGQAQ